MAVDRMKGFTAMIAERIRVARKDARLTQGQLSEKLGFKDRQILSNIEGGSRKVTSEEMVALMRHLGKDLDFFTDPFRLINEGVFSWRAIAETSVLAEFEEKAKVWIATYRTLGRDLEEPIDPLVHQLGLSERSSFEDAWASAEALRRLWDLGERPAANLPAAIEKKTGTLVLRVDAPAGISGAACHLADFNAVLINRRESAGRQVYDLAHELFHVLTWGTMPPEHRDVENPTRNKIKRAESLAENFAGALLMPEEPIANLWRSSEGLELHERIIAAADDFRVTAKAMRSRLKALKLLVVSDIFQIAEARLAWNGKAPKEQQLQPLFSRLFVERIVKGLDHGLISMRKAGALLGCTLGELHVLIHAHGLESPAELRGLVEPVTVRRTGPTTKVTQTVKLKRG